VTYRGTIRVGTVPRSRVVAIVPCCQPITGWIQADLAIMEQLSRRGWPTEIVTLSDHPDAAPRYRWRDQLRYNLRLIRRFRGAPVGCILLEDQALSSAVGIFNWYARRRLKARVVLLTHHLVFDLFENPLRSFVLPGGQPAAAWCHLVRTVCRRAERDVVTLGRAEPVNPEVVIYLNRLSDLLFVLGRVYNNNGQDDVLWQPGKGQSDPTP